MELDFELGFGKYRYTVNGEIQERKEREKEKETTGIGVEEEEMTGEKRLESEIVNAKSRQAFDPVERQYDA